jgi:acyl carrier protein
MGQFDEDIRRIVGEHARLSLDASTLTRDSDLYAAGMTSHASVGVMLGLEDRFEVEFPEHLLTPAVFASIAAMSHAIAELGGEAAQTTDTRATAHAHHPSADAQERRQRARAGA